VGGEKGRKLRRNCHSSGRRKSRHVLRIRGWADLDDLIKPRTRRLMIIGNSRSGIVSEGSFRHPIRSKPCYLPATYIRISS
jgi:hypothetical protein